MEENYNQQEEGLCKCCGIQPIDRSGNPDSILCAQCRERLIKSPVPKLIYAAIAVIAILFATAPFPFPQSMSALKTYKCAA